MTADISPVNEMEAVRERARSTGRAALGVVAEEDRVGLMQGLRASGAGLYPVIALGLLLLVDGFLATGLVVLAPDVSRTLGIPKAGIAAFGTIGSLAFVLSTLVIARLVQNRPARALVAKVTAFGWSAMTLAAAFVTGAWSLLAVEAADQATSGSVGSVHVPLVMDTYIPAVRMRMVAGYRIFAYVAAVVSPLLVSLLTGPLHLTWRGTILVFGVACVVASAVALRLRDPGFGRLDTARLRAEVGLSEQAEEPRIALGFFEILRRLYLVPTFRLTLLSTAVFAMLGGPLTTYVTFFLQDKYGVDAAGRGIFFAIVSAGAIVATLVFSRFADRLYRESPARLLRVNSVLQGAAILLLPVTALVPSLALMTATFVVVVATYSAVNPAIQAAVLNVIEPRMRPHAAALQGIFGAAVGAPIGLILLSGADQRYGTTVAISLLVVPGLASAVILRAAAKTIPADLDRTVDEIVEEEELTTLRRSGARLPMLSCRRINFAYGQLQVLFDVDFTVADGEMVGLLGTNGAGKSTLLRVISGGGFPSSGTVRFNGADITFLDPQRRVGLGITQIPGGRAVFRSMTVAENLHMFGYSLGRRSPVVTARVDDCYAAFPRLAERRNQPAATLSGGEQQMLGLSKALILRPRLLLIDELSLGLAPKVVTDLLATVRRINQSGTAVVLVEQSVNVALSLVEHAYFMEKGQVRFDGRASDLIERDDLVRSVFLEGAAKAVGAVIARPDGAAP